MIQRTHARVYTPMAHVFKLLNISGSDPIIRSFIHATRADKPEWSSLLENFAVDCA